MRRCQELPRMAIEHDKLIWLHLQTELLKTADIIVACLACRTYQQPDIVSQGTGHTLVFLSSDDWRSSQSDGATGCGTAVRRADVCSGGLNTAHTRCGRAQVVFAPCLWGAPERVRVACSGCATQAANAELATSLWK